MKNVYPYLRHNPFKLNWLEWPNNSSTFKWYQLKLHFSKMNDRCYYDILKNYEFLNDFISPHNSLPTAVLSCCIKPEYIWFNSLACFPQITPKNGSKLCLKQIFSQYRITIFVISNLESNMCKFSFNMYIFSNNFIASYYFVSTYAIERKLVTMSAGTPITIFVFT